MIQTHNLVIGSHCSLTTPKSFAKFVTQESEETKFDGEEKKEDGEHKMVQDEAARKEKCLKTLPTSEIPPSSEDTLGPKTPPPAKSETDRQELSAVDLLVMRKRKRCHSARDTVMSPTRNREFKFAREYWTNFMLVISADSFESFPKSSPISKDEWTWDMNKIFVILKFIYLYIDVYMLCMVPQAWISQCPVKSGFSHIDNIA